MSMSDSIFLKYLDRSESGPCVCTCEARGCAPGSMALQSPLGGTCWTESSLLPLFLPQQLGGLIFLAKNYPALTLAETAACCPGGPRTKGGGAAPSASHMGTLSVPASGLPPSCLTLSPCCLLLARALACLFPFH